jgi:hypothetical protein
METRVSTVDIIFNPLGVPSTGPRYGEKNTGKRCSLVLVIVGYPIPAHMLKVAGKTPLEVG